MANINSKYFDDIKITKKKEAEKASNLCQWKDCNLPAAHRAPIGRGQEGKYLNFCLNHVREYNKNYNYFEGMNQSDLSKFQKESMLGNRPTWKLGVNNKEQLGNYSAEEILKKLKADKVGANTAQNETSQKTAARRQKIGNAGKKALYVLGLDSNSSSDEIKNKYKLLVKRHHPDLKGGNETTDEKLIEIIKSYRYLKSIGFVN